MSRNLQKRRRLPRVWEGQARELGQRRNLASFLRRVWQEEQWEGIVGFLAETLLTTFSI